MVELSKQGLFILGHARSGTTILQNTLNSSPQIFLFGEANFYLHRNENDFRTHYNSQHRTFRNQETKSTYLPAIFGERDGCWEKYFTELSRFYRYVGDKIAVGPEKYGHSTTALFDFFAEEFYDSIYLFMLRNPYDSIVSTKHLLLDASFCDICESMALVYLLLVRMIRNFPNVKILFLEQIDRAELIKLGDFLGVELSDSGEYYDVARIHRYAEAATPHGIEEVISTLTETYLDLKSLAIGETSNLQLEQKERAECNSNPNLPGRIYNRCTVLVDQIVQRKVTKSLEVCFEKSVTAVE